jgi:iron only hydrogenase large subunit-like protein
MNETQTLINLIEKKEKLAAMLAPSFPIVYDYPEIITRLKKLGFSYVVEVSAGAKKTNEELIQLLDKNPKARFITSPCPTVVRMIRKQFPHLEKYLSHGVDSPMVATAKIVIEKYPDYRPVFIGPCIVKKLEANEDFPELNILVLTYKEIDQVFDYFKIPKQLKTQDSFDISEPGMTRLYPTDGGLAHSSGLKDKLKDQVRIVSGWKNCLEAIKNFETDPNIRLLDILYCEGGCINGPGILSNQSLDQRINSVLEFSKSSG